MVRRTLHTRPDRLIGPDEDCCWKDGEMPCAEGSWAASKYPRLDWLLDIIVADLGVSPTGLTGIRSQAGSFSHCQPLILSVGPPSCIPPSDATHMTVEPFVGGLENV